MIAQYILTVTVSYSHLSSIYSNQIGHFMNKLFYIEDEKKYLDIKNRLQSKNTLFLELKKTDIDNEKDLFTTISKQLKFPSYFGSNWDALHECLSDLSWINSTEIVVLIHSVETFQKSSVGEKLFDILKYVVENWEKQGQKRFTVYAFR